MIFISHNHADKPVVEPVALRLREIFGEDQVFYDSWSIQPGEGIIDKMNEGLSAPDFVFFFVSEKSLASGMVKLEWQNALVKASKGRTRLVPVRVDGTEMPAVLLQNLYIDMFSQGVEATIKQIVGVTQGMSSFTPQHVGFSNLTYTHSTNPDGSLTVTVVASHLMEPDPSFLVMVDNKEGEMNATLPDYGIAYTGFTENVPLEDGRKVNVQSVSALGGVITPKKPLRIVLTPVDGKVISFRGVMHKVTGDEYRAIPPRP